MIVLITNSKGGCGKSTVTVNISALLANRKKDVVLLDCDRIGTSTNWLEARSENETYRVIASSSHQGAGKLIAHIKQLQKKHDMVIIDSAGADSEVMRTCMLVADVILIPFRPSQPDMDELPAMQQLIEDTHELNPKARVHFLINAAKPGSEKTEIRESIDYFKHHHIIPAKTILYDRKDYREAMANGCGVIDRRNAKAIEEIKNLTKEIGLW